MKIGFGLSELPVFESQLNEMKVVVPLSNNIINSMYLVNTFLPSDNGLRWNLDHYSVYPQTVNIRGNRMIY